MASRLSGQAQDDDFLISFGFTTLQVARVRAIQASRIKGDWKPRHPASPPSLNAPHPNGNPHFWRDWIMTRLAARGHDLSWERIVRDGRVKRRADEWHDQEVIKE